MKNIIINGECVEEMKKLPDESVDLMVTSPPYADKRKDSYGGIAPEFYADWLFGVSKEVMRLLKPTGSFIINIKEGCDNGIRELYVLDYQYKMAKEYRWVDTFIWHKTNPFPTGSQRRLKDGWEHCFHFAKTKYYKFFPNQVAHKSTSKWADDCKRRKNKGQHNVTNGSHMNMSKRVVSELVRPSNVIMFPSSCLNIGHPAVFPLDLPNFFIKLMTEPDDLVLDPFVGSGTTVIAAQQLNRKYLGIELNKDYIELAEKRIKELVIEKVKVEVI